MAMIARGSVEHADGEPAADRKIFLQVLTVEGWQSRTDADPHGFEVEVPLDGGLQRQGTAPPVRLVDETDGEPMVLSADPVWSREGIRGGGLLVADFGRIVLLKEPYRRQGLKLEGELVLGIPAELPIGSGSRAEDQELKKRLAETEGALRDTTAKLLDTTTQLTDTAARLTETTARLSDSGAELASARAELTEKDSTLLRIRDERDSVRVELSDALTKVADLSAVQGTPTRVVDVISGLGTQLSATNAELATKTTPFRLAAVTLDLRGRLGGDGSTIVMDGSADGSGLKADLVVDQASTQIPAQTVPDVAGLTPSAAARVLRSVGFRMDTATQQLPPGTGVPGQALTQHPAPAAQAEHGTAVLVVFGVSTDGARNDDE